MEISTENGFTYREEDFKIILNYQDLRLFPEYPETPLLELTNGELFMVPSPNPRHQTINLNLAVLIRNFLSTDKIAKVFVPPIDVLLNENNVVIPDLVIIKKEKFSIVQDKYINGVPDCVVEILSTNKKSDEIRKKEMYQKFGVSEYWIISPEDETIQKFLFNKNFNSYQLEGVYKNGKNHDIINETLQYNISLNQIFAE